MKKNWINWLIVIFKEFISDFAKKSEYKILDIYECQKTGCTKAQVKLYGRHIIEKNINEIVTDLTFLENFDKKTIRTLTYIATIERLKPDFSIVVQQLGSEVDDYILKICARNGKEITNKTPSEMSKDKLLLFCQHLFIGKMESSNAWQIFYFSKFIIYRNWASFSYDHC